MDNVMFQIECALLPVEGSELATEISLVKRFVDLLPIRTRADGNNSDYSME